MLAGSGDGDGGAAAVDVCKHFFWDGGSMLHNPLVKINHHNSWCLQTKQYYTHAKTRGNTRHKVKHLGKSLEFVKLYTCA